MKKAKLVKLFGVRVYAHILKRIEWARRKLNYDFNKVMEAIKRHMPQVALTVAVASWRVFGQSVEAFAVTTGGGSKGLAGIGVKIRELLNPIIELFAGLGLPITYFMLIVGILLIITGSKHKGMEIIKWAVVGFLFLQFAPFILIMLEEFGKALRMGLTF